MGFPHFTAGSCAWIAIIPMHKNRVDIRIFLIIVIITNKYPAKIRKIIKKRFLKKVYFCKKTIV